MVVTTVKVESANSSGPGEPEPLEVAAAMAAVFAYLDGESALSRPPGQESDTTGGGWLRASQLESTGCRRLTSAQPALGLSLWRSTPLVLFFWLLASTSAFAQMLDAEQNLAQADLPSAGNRKPAQSLVAVRSPGNGFAQGASFDSHKDPMRIALALNAARAEITAVDGAQIRDAVTGSLLATLPAQSQWTVDLKSTASGLQLAFAGRRQGDLLGNDTKYGGGRARNVAYLGGRSVPLSSQLRLPLTGRWSQIPPGGTAQAANSYVLTAPGDDEAAGVIAVNGQLYRGKIWLSLSPKTQGAQGQPADAQAGFNVINLIDLEDYLLSVLPSEMPSSWPLEALKAQAIAARSYAVANLGKHAAQGYDLKATTDDQVYLGVCSENENSNRAVAETEGLVLKHDGKAVTAFFHSTSGGSTELAEHVWGKPLPYLQAVADYDDASPHFAWTRHVAVPDLEKALPDIGKVLALTVVARTASNRAQYVLVVGSGSCQLLSGHALRRLLKLPSTLFNIGCEDNGYVFAGRGFGHGLGMSQYGARALAERGYNAAQILAYYYKDVIVDFIQAAPGI